MPPLPPQPEGMQPPQTVHHQQEIAGRPTELPAAVSTATATADEDGSFSAASHDAVPEPPPMPASPQPQEGQPPHPQQHQEEIAGRATVPAATESSVPEASEGNFVFQAVYHIVSSVKLST